MQQVNRRSGSRAVHSVEHFVYTVPDLDEAERFYRAFGLDVQRETSPGREALRLRTFGHAHTWGTLYQAPGAKRLQYVSFGIFEDDEATFGDRIGLRGIGIDAHALGDKRGLWLRGPDERHGYSQGWGLDRHVLGSNYFYYARDPWGRSRRRTSSPTTSIRLPPDSGGVPGRARGRFYASRH